MTTDISPMPSTSVEVPKVKRATGCMTSMPMVAIITPRAVVTTLLAMAPRCEMPMTTSAKRISENLPGVWMSRARLAATGVNRIRKIAPMVPPIIEPRAAWPSALAPCPCCISG